METQKFFTVCWKCRTKTDALSGSSPHRPEAGDFDVCTNCGVIGVFTGQGGELREPTYAELLEFKNNRAGMILYAEIQRLLKKKNAN